MLNFEYILHALTRDEMIFKVNDNIITMLLADNGFQGILALEWLEYWADESVIRESEDGYGTDHYLYFNDCIVIISI